MHWIELNKIPLGMIALGIIGVVTFLTWDKKKPTSLYMLSSKYTALIVGIMAIIMGIHGLFYD